MSRRIHKAKPSDGLRHRSWAATTTSTGKEEEDEKKKKYGLLHNLLWAREEEEEEWDLLHNPLWAKEPQCDIAGIEEEDSNSVSPSDSNNLEVVSGIPPVEQEVEREKTSATPSPTGDQDLAITKELKQATKFTYFATATTKELKQATKFSYLATALAGGGILSLLIFHLESKSGEPHTLFFKALISFVLTTFVSGLSIILLTICAALVFLAIMGVGVSIVLMKIMSEQAFVPAIVVVIVSWIIVHCKKSTDLVNIDHDGRGLSNHHPCDV